MALISRLTREKGLTPSQGMVLLGFAADGFPIYAPFAPVDPWSGGAFKHITSSYQLKRGQRRGPSYAPRGAYDGTYVQDYQYVAGSGDLDECNGRVGVTPEYPNGIYHYFVTETFPFVSRRFRGTPNPWFLHPLPTIPVAVPPVLANVGQ